MKTFFTDKKKKHHFAKISSENNIFSWFQAGLELHTVTTEDGYVLTIFRMPGKLNYSSTSAVLLQHGLENNLTFSNRNN